MSDQGDPPRARAIGANVARLDAGANRDVARTAGRDPSGLGRSPRIDPVLKLRQPAPYPWIAPSPSSHRSPHGWPTEIAFLTHYGVAPGVLSAAVAAAKRQGVSAEEALLACGAVSETHFYQSLARHLRLPFIDWHAAIAASARYPRAVHAGLAPLAEGEGPAFLIAPRGAAIAYLILAAYRGELHGRLAIATPTHFSGLLRTAFRAQILHDASFALPCLDPALCARRKAWRHKRFAIAGVSLLALFTILTVAGSTALGALPLGIVFLAVVLLRGIMAQTPPGLRNERAGRYSPRKFKKESPNQSWEA
ncbi:MAG: hypothetical protein WCF20_03640 [Methylovirgula sp.]